MVPLSLISGRKAAIRFSPVAKVRFESTTRVMASQTSPGPVSASRAVPRIQPMVVTSRKRFLAA